MVEGRGFPLIAVMATDAISFPVLGELLAMDIFVALLALGRRRLEVHVGQLGFQVGRLVAVGTGRRAMRPYQRECGFGVIEAR